MPSHYYIGTDEAGYGPNLGPLVVCATFWESGTEREIETLYQPLEGIVSTTGGSAAVFIADSKRVYRQTKPVGLERAVFVPARTLAISPRYDYDLWRLLAPGAYEQQRELPWFGNSALRLPLHADPVEIEASAIRLTRRFDETDFRLKRILASAIFPARFNALVEETGSKGALLSNETMRLVTALTSEIGEGTMHVVCDKHGGRNRYRPLLEEHFAAFVEIHEESPARSLYRFGPDSRRFEFTFRTKAEACLPVALASCVAKYLRELAMRRFNAFWRRHLPDLNPTAGYPQDARRFLYDIKSTADRLGLAQSLFWRNR